MSVAQFIAGLVLVLAGGELVVRGASQLAAATGIRPLVIGLTVVAFGTSSPELAIGIHAARAGGVDIAIGNVVGSNIFNVLFILGVTALIVPLRVSSQLIRLDVPVMIAVSFLLLAASVNRVISPLEGLLFTAGIIGYVIMQVIVSRRTDPVTPTFDDAYSGIGRMPINCVLIAAGLVLLVFGAAWIVDGAVSVARALGVTELVIGLTIVTVGTSTPELATAIIAGLRGQSDIAVGNIVGSSIFNVLAVLGISALASADGLPMVNAVVTFDIPVMVAVAVLCFPIFFSGSVINRWEGLLFIGYYALYVGYLVLAAAQDDDLAGYSALVLRVVLPLTLATLAIFHVIGWHKVRRSGEPDEAELDNG